MKLSQEQITKIKAHLPKCVFLRIRADGSPAFLVRVSTHLGAKHTIGTYDNPQAAVAALESYRIRNAPKQDNADVEAFVQSVQSFTIPPEVKDYLDNIPPHELSEHQSVLMTTPNGGMYEIKANIVRAYLYKYVFNMSEPQATPQAIDQTSTEESNEDWHLPEEVEQEEALNKRTDADLFDKLFKGED